MGLLDRLKGKKQTETEAAAEPEAEETVEEQPVEETTEASTEESKTATKSGGAYFVSPHPDGGWQVKKANAQKALKRFKTKAEAEAYAKQVASNQGTSVVRQKKDGKIQKKH
ncbi:MAG: DUF2188 domain-containing protein [Thermoplasmata archaeon]|nr:DUF2188 domain-containing protein [Thermoplasmata archaeon]